MEKSAAALEFVGFIQLLNNRPPSHFLTPSRTYYQSQLSQRRKRRRRIAIFRQRGGGAQIRREFAQFRKIPQIGPLPLRAGGGPEMGHRESSADLQRFRGRLWAGRRVSPLRRQRAREGGATSPPNFAKIRQAPPNRPLPPRGRGIRDRRGSAKDRQEFWDIDRKYQRIFDFRRQ